jgi:D-alanyl-lipoteichoic acid acyltransferase DltB (MBOAT superfamily)
LTFKKNKSQNFVDYSLFVSYFPLLVAGPIERATLPQVKVKRSLIIKKQRRNLPIYLGFIKKVVIADTCATYANAILIIMNL